MKSEQTPMANKLIIGGGKDKAIVDKPLRATHGSPDRPLKIGNAEILFLASKLGTTFGNLKGYHPG